MRHEAEPRSEREETIMKRWIATPLFIACLTTASAMAAFAASPMDQVKWLLEMFGELSPADEPLVSRVREVFERVRAAADKRANCDPRLLIIRNANEPWALCLEDGTIVLTQQALDICHQHVDPETGDSRVAFVLGHELAHLAENDFWDWQAFETVSRFGPGTKALQEILRLLAIPESVKETDRARDAGNRKEFLVIPENVKETNRARDARKRKELRADSHGLLYAAMAGYDPKAVVDEGRNFLREWVGQITGEAAYGGDHPDPDTRAAFLRSHMKSVADAYDLFDIGVRLCQVGNYSDALDFLTAFQKRFPSREVLNNIGLCHLQLAMGALGEYDPERACRWRLSLILDTETRAKSFRGEADARRTFKKEMRKAIRHLKEACEKDPHYVPARVNLSVAYMMTGKRHHALSSLEEVLTLGKDDPAALNNHAVAMHELQSHAKIDYSKQTVLALRRLTKTHPKFADPWYNLGQVLFEANRTAAKDAWREYLKLEHLGERAAIVRRKLGIDPPDLVTRSSVMPPLVRPGKAYKEVRARLSDFHERPLELGNISARRFSGGDLHILILENTVRLVESRMRKKTRLSELNVGPKRRTLPRCSGAKTFVYDGFALDVRDGMVERVVHF